ncbi:MAG: polysaccharide pyruvyl transferase family protein [Gammaproteobacteria bacterium]|nr:polysaccharide pyruvyl transferase family protein [Gammaproteobacteria bacterium]
MPHVNELLDPLRTQIRLSLDPLISPGACCALIDFPHHGNVGDSAIWLGEMAYLKSRNCKVVYTCDAGNYNAEAMRSAIGDGSILITGGGNFGDLYPIHQNLRERVIREFPDNRIIQFPQSIYFADDGNLARSQAILSKHKEFHFVVRDTVSLRLAQKHYDNPTYLCPDMAMMLDLRSLRSQRKAADVVVLSRVDEEKAAHLTAGTGTQLNSVVMDWLDEPEPKHQWLYDWSHRRLGWGSSKIPPFILNGLALMAANAMARQRLARGLGILGQGNVVVTDRLHAIILSWLGGTPVFFVDNNYNKLSNFINTWLKDNPGLVRCASFEDALEQARTEYWPASPATTSNPV